MKRRTERRRTEFRSLCDAAIDEAYMDRARNMAAHPNPDVPLFVASMSDAWYELVGNPAIERLVMYGEQSVFRDPTPEELAEPMARAMDRNRVYLDRALAEKRIDAARLIDSTLGDDKTG